MRQRPKVNTDAVKILHGRYVQRKPKMKSLLIEERANVEIAQKLADLRIQARLTQQQLAKLVGTTPSVICRLEDADYEGHSLTMLRRVAAALNNLIEVRFKPLKESVQTA
jgi:DNA-binding XRE family transcriptional regulator